MIPPWLSWHNISWYIYIYITFQLLHLTSHVFFCWRLHSSSLAIWKAAEIAKWWGCSRQSSATWGRPGGGWRSKRFKQCRALWNLGSSSQGVKSWFDQLQLLGQAWQLAWAKFDLTRSSLYMVMGMMQGIVLPIVPVGNSGIVLFRQFASKIVATYRGKPNDKPAVIVSFRVPQVNLKQ